MAYQPIIEALAPLGRQVDRFAGTSAGAITAMLLAVRARPERIGEILAETPWDTFAPHRFPALLRLFVTGGWHPIGGARQWLLERLVEEGYDDRTTFRDVYDRHRTHLAVVATRYQRPGGHPPTIAQPFVFSLVSTPYERVRDAVLASMAVQLFWPPVEVGGWWYGDGGLAMNHPLSLYASLPREEVLGVRVDTSQEIEAETAAPAAWRPLLGEIVRSNAKMLREVANRAYVPEELWERIVRVEAPAGQAALDFHLTPARREALVEAGRLALAEWLAK